MNTQNPCPQKQHTHCLFRTQESDRYVGRLTSSRLIENKLTIIFSKVVRVVEGEEPRWRTTGNVLENYQIEFEGCIIGTENENTLEISSSIGEMVTLTSLSVPVEMIEKLLTEGVAEKLDV